MTPHIHQVRSAELSASTAETTKMKKNRKFRARRVRRRGKRYDRVTIKFRDRVHADEDRARVQDALVRTHGFRLIAGLTAALARSLGRWRAYVRHGLIKVLKKRLQALVQEGGIALWVAGQRV
jgi:hypothetical protein